MQMTSMNPKFMHMILSTGVTPDVIAPHKILGYVVCKILPLKFIFTFRN